MWITVFLVSLTLLLSCNAQVTNSDVYSETETSRTNQDVQWDTTGPSVTLSIRDGRSDNANRQQSEISNRPLFYSNQWKPFLMPIGFNNQGEINNRNQAEGEGSINYPFIPTFLRRPDSDQNRTSPGWFAQSSNGYRSQFASLPMPMAPINPMFFYPRQPNFFPNGYFQEASPSENISAPAPGTTVSTADASSLRDVQDSTVPSSPFSPMPDILERFHPITFYRNRGDFISPRPPAIAPTYPLVPNTNVNSLHPMVFPFLNGHIFDREAGSDVRESISTGQDAPGIETPVTSRDVPEQEPTIANSATSDTSPTFVPPEPLPLPVAGFPFGVLPPPMFHPMIPGPALAGGVPFGPMPGPLSLIKDDIFEGAVPPQPPVAANLPPLESPLGVLPPVNTLLSEVELPETTEADGERILPGEIPDEANTPYAFGFDMNDGEGTDQHRKEVSDLSGTVRGSYGYRDMLGVYRFVNYIADKNGFRAFIKSNEPGVASSGSADVVVLAEQPPIQAIAEGARASEPEAVVVADTATDLVAEGSEAATK